MTIRTITTVSILALFPLAAMGITLQPDEAASEDAFIYQGLPTFNLDGAPFGAFLATSENSIGHITRSLIRFDLSGLSISAGDVTSATLNLYVTDGTAFGGVFADPSPTATATVGVSAADADWDESLVTWLTQPGTVAGGPVSTTSIDGINQWISLDVTGLVTDMLRDVSDPDFLDNFGFQLAQTVEVVDPGSGARVGVVYESADNANRPFLTIVPEPATLGLLLLGAAAGIRRRR